MGQQQPCKRLLQSGDPGVLFLILSPVIFVTNSKHTTRHLPATVQPLHNGHTEMQTLYEVNKAGTHIAWCWMVQKYFCEVRADCFIFPHMYFFFVSFQKHGCRKIYSSVFNSEETLLKYLCPNIQLFLVSRMIEFHYLSRKEINSSISKNVTNCPRILLWRQYFGLRGILKSF